MSSVSYYVYGSSIARVNSESCAMEIKEHKTDLWKPVKEPLLWRRIQEEGDCVGKEEAEAIFKRFKEDIDKNRNSSE